MLGRKQYEDDYIAYCRKKVTDDVEAFRTLKSVPKGFEAVFFNNMVLVLEQMFVHRLRVVEGKDGNPCNEVRMLANSILINNNKLLPDHTIRYKPAHSILKLNLGDHIALSVPDFLQLYQAYFDEIGTKFGRKY